MCISCVAESSEDVVYDLEVKKAFSLKLPIEWMEKKLLRGVQTFYDVSRDYRSAWHGIEC